jgi:hypothetical protein
MSANRYPPGREADLITATQTFHDVANVSPVTYSLTAASRLWNYNKPGGIG